jgi:hypothetical protein
LLEHAIYGTELVLVKPSGAHGKQPKMGKMFSPIFYLFVIYSNIISPIFQDFYLFGKYLANHKINGRDDKG